MFLQVRTSHFNTVGIIPVLDHFMHFEQLQKLFQGQIKILESHLNPYYSVETFGKGFCTTKK